MTRTEVLDTATSRPTRRRLWIGLTVLAVAVPAFLAAPELFPRPPGPEPTGRQLLLFIVLSACDSLLLGIGAAFVVFGWPLVHRVAPGSRARATALFLGVAWITLSWYPHIGLHGSAFGSTPDGVLTIDYTFHLPLYAATVAIIWALVGHLKTHAQPIPQ